MVDHYWHLQKQKRDTDNGFLMRVGGEVKSINSGEDLGDEMGDHSKLEAVDKDEGLL